MHLLVSWEFRAQNPQNVPINAELVAIVQAYPFVHVLPNSYVVTVTSADQYQEVLNRLVAVAQRNPNSFYMIISPPMTGGRYGGFLPSTLWPEINNRTT